MIIRALQESDLNQLKEIHACFYKDEFDLPDFFNKFLCSFVVIDDDTIISAGGVRTIAESIIITNKNVSVKTRREALYHILQASMFTCGSSGYDQLHAFIQDDNWQKHLVKIGFKSCKGNAIFLNI
jgi:hypothetical protein